MKDSERKPRNKIIKKVDLLKPVDINKFGTEDDPCFGKLYEPKCAECSRCGDSELCAISFMQANAIKRTQLESKQKFKDKEESEIPKADKAEIKKEIRKRMRKVIRDAKDNGARIDAVEKAIFGAFSKDGFTQREIGKILTRLIEKETRIIKTNNLLKWKEQ